MVDYQNICGRCRGPVVVVLDSRSSSLSSSPGCGQCVVFLGKTHHSRSAALHPGLQSSHLSVRVYMTCRQALHDRDRITTGLWTWNWHTLCLMLETS